MNLEAGRRVSPERSLGPPTQLRRWAGMLVAIGDGELIVATHRNRRIQFVSDALVQQIVEGRKTASVVGLGEVDVADGEYDDPLVVGEYYDVYDSTLVARGTIRIVGMELCRWEGIPERLWRGETNSSADEFRRDHLDYFEDPGPGFEFVAYYFQLAQRV